jgi:hypothetical protein
MWHQIKTKFPKNINSQFTIVVPLLFHELRPQFTIVVSEHYIVKCIILFFNDDDKFWPFLWNILEPIINLKTFYEGLNNKKHIQILKFLKGHC